MAEQKSKYASLYKWNMAGDLFNEAHKKLLDEYQARKGQDMYDALQKYQEMSAQMIESLQHLATSQATSANRIFDKKKDFECFMNDYYQYCKLNQKQAETYEELNRNKKLIVTEWANLLQHQDPRNSDYPAIKRHMIEADARKLTTELVNYCKTGKKEINALHSAVQDVKGLRVGSQGFRNDMLLTALLKFPEAVSLAVEKATGKETMKNFYARAPYVNAAVGCAVRCLVDNNTDYDRDQRPLQVGMEVEACIAGMNAWHPALILCCNQDEYDIEFTEYPYAKKVKTGIKRREIRPLLEDVLPPPELFRVNILPGIRDQDSHLSRTLAHNELKWAPEQYDHETHEMNKKMKETFCSVANNATMTLWSRSAKEAKNDTSAEPLIGALVNNRYRIKRYIAHGSFGHTWVAEDTLSPDATTPLVRCLKTPRARHDMSRDLLRQAIKEVREELATSRMLVGTFQKLKGMVNVLDVSQKKHPAPIVTTSGVVGKIHFIVQEYCEAGDFHGFTQRRLSEAEAKELGEQKGTMMTCRFDEPVAAYLFKQVMVTVNKLHKDGIYHRDIKLENFLVAREQGHYQLKMCDYGRLVSVDKRPKDEKRGIEAHALPPPYYAPETRMKPGERTFYEGGPADIWSCGVLLLRLLLMPRKTPLYWIPKLVDWMTPLKRTEYLLDLYKIKKRLNAKDVSEVIDFLKEEGQLPSIIVKDWEATDGKEIEITPKERAACLEDADGVFPSDDDFEPFDHFMFNVKFFHDLDIIKTHDSDSSNSECALSSDCIALLKNLFKYDPAKRFTADKVLESAWLQKGNLASASAVDQDMERRKQTGPKLTYGPHEISDDIDIAFDKMFDVVKNLQKFYKDTKLLSSGGSHEGNHGAKEMMISVCFEHGTPVDIMCRLQEITRPTKHGGRKQKCVLTAKWVVGFESALWFAFHRALQETFYDKRSDCGEVLETLFEKSCNYSDLVNWTIFSEWRLSGAASNKKQTIEKLSELFMAKREFLDVASIFPEQLKRGTVIDIGKDGIVTVEMFPHGKRKPYTQKYEGKYLQSEITPLQKGSIVKAPRKFDVIHKKVKELTEIFAQPSFHFLIFLGPGYTFEPALSMFQDFTRLGFEVSVVTKSGKHVGPKRAWPSSATVAFSTVVANVKPLSAHAGDSFIDKGIVYLQPDLAGDVEAFLEGVAPTRRFSWLVSFDADGDADLREVFEVIGPNLMISAEDQSNIGETRSRIGSHDRFNQLITRKHFNNSHKMPRKRRGSNASRKSTSKLRRQHSFAAIDMADRCVGLLQNYLKHLSHEGAYQRFEVEGETETLLIPKTAARNKLTRIKNQLLDIIKAIENLGRDELPDQKMLASVHAMMLFKDKIARSVFEKGVISNEDKIKHGIRKISKAAHSAPWHKHLFDSLNQLKKAAQERQAAAGTDRVLDRNRMKKADNVRARLVLTHNMFLDVLNQWCKDGHVSEKELREMEAQGLQMRALPQNAHDFEYFEDSCNA